MLFTAAVIHLFRMNTHSLFKTVVTAGVACCKCIAAFFVTHNILPPKFELIGFFYIP